MTGAHALVEAAYLPASSEHAWLDALATTALPLLDRGLGVAAYTFTRGKRGRVALGPIAARGATTTAVSTLIMATNLTPQRDLKKIYFDTGCCSTLSEFAGARRLERDPIARTYGALTGIADYLAVKGIDVSGPGVAIGVFMPAIEPLAPDFRKKWERAGAHLAAAARLRGKRTQRSDGLPQDTEAVLEPDGGLLHAEGEAREACEALMLQAKRVDRARARARFEDPLEVWTALCEARWSLTDHFETDGRRLIVARENAPTAIALPGLTQRERQVVTLAARGDSCKFIAYELGVSESTVRTLERRAMNKLGIESRLDLIKLVSALS